MPLSPFPPDQQLHRRPLGLPPAKQRELAQQGRVEQQALEWQARVEQQALEQPEPGNPEQPLAVLAPLQAVGLSPLAQAEPPPFNPCQLCLSLNWPPPLL